MNTNKIHSINGPVVTVKNATDFSMMEMVLVGNKKLMGEVIKITTEKTTIQVYESTTSLKAGEPVLASGSPISMTLGPGILQNIFDGIGRPLKAISDKFGAFITSGVQMDSLDSEIEWNVKITRKVNDEIHFGDIFAKIQETDLIEHRIMVPKGVIGVITEIKPSGKYRINDALVKIKDESGKIHELTMVQRWPIKTPRPVSRRLQISIPLITGQRVIDTFFPIAKGGTAGVPGGFGTGKTMMLHQLAKWCDADMIVYIGCGERGNEMTQVLEEFAELRDPKTNKPLSYRTVFIANTSNMPVAAREASIYTGLTIAEYYRDMGYHVAVMADSTSRWAEALREISGRLEEMPAEEGFPAYLPSRLSQFYERAGYMETMNKQIGSVSIIGAVSPQGADFSEPVTQNTKRFVRCFWALDKQLAYARHYEAINWNISYSEYVGDLEKWYNKKIDIRFLQNRKKLMKLLAEENKLMEIVKLIGSDVLPDDQRLVLEISRVIRVGFLQQNAFHKEDVYVPMQKQLRMMDVILYLYQKCVTSLREGRAFSLIQKTNVFEKVIKMKYDIPNNNLEMFDAYFTLIDETIYRIG